MGSIGLRRRRGAMCRKDAICLATGFVSAPRLQRYQAQCPAGLSLESPQEWQPLPILDYPLGGPVGQPKIEIVQPHLNMP
jgi:hypothetical protein